jgi:hypothetical protein
MDILIYQPSEIPADDRERIQHVLRLADVFVPSFDPSDADAYDVMTYAFQEAFGVEVLLFVDRNVFTRWVNLLDKLPARDGNHRIAAAILAFAQLARLSIDPSMAVYEYAAAEGNLAASRELSQFPTANEFHPREWTAIALGRSDILSSSVELPENSPAYRDLSAARYPWQRSYILALKIADLHLRGGRSEAMMRCLLEWMYEDFLISGPAVLLASHYLAPGAQRRGLFKNIESSDRERALAGIRNAAWDLTLLSEWLQRLQRKQEPGSRQPVVILCSLDEAVKRIARSVINRNHPQVTDHEYLAGLFKAFWGDENGKRLSSLLMKFQENADSPHRQFNRGGRQADPGFMEKMINDGEDRIRDWKRR